MGMFGMFEVVGLFIFLGFIAIAVIIVLFIVGIIRSGQKEKARRTGPMMSSPATVIDKRIETTGGGDFSVTEHYYATFEFPSGERRELEVERQLYGLLADGDQGEVSLSSDWCRGFQRQILR